MRNTGLNQRRQALENLRDLKRSGKRQIDVFELKEEAKLYDEVEDEGKTHITYHSTQEQMHLRKLR